MRKTLRGKSIRKTMLPALRKRQLFPMRRFELAHGKAVSSLEQSMKFAKEDYDKFVSYYSNAVRHPASKFQYGYTPSHIKEIRGQMKARQQSYKSLLRTLKQMRELGGVKIW